MLSKSPSVPQLISEKIRLKSRIQSRNYLLGEFRQIVKRENKRDSERIAEIERKLNAGKPKVYKSFLFF
jgi:hypothetical protein